MDTDQQHRFSDWDGLAPLLVAAPIAVGALLVGVRGEIDAANVALILVLTVVAVAAVTGRGPAAVSAILAAASYEFFFTRPYLSLRISSGDDVLTTAILLLIALVVGQVGAVARRRAFETADARAQTARLRRVAARLAHGDSGRDMIAAVTDEVSQLLTLQHCTFEEDPTDPSLPLIDRDGRVATTAHKLVDGGFALPDGGVRLPVLGANRALGSLVLVGDPEVGVSLEQRLVAVALADELGSALVAHGASD